MLQIQGNSDKLICFYPDSGFFYSCSQYSVTSTGNVTGLAQKSVG